MKKILVTGFKPFGITGTILKRNESEKIVLKLKEKYGFETLILPVDDSCIPMLIEKIKKYQPEIIIGFGVVGLGQSKDFRIETMCRKDNRALQSLFALNLKVDLKKGDIEDNIGEWYCNKVYFESLSRVPNSVFIHIPYFIKFKKLEPVIDYILEHERI